VMWTGRVKGRVRVRVRVRVREPPSRDVYWMV